MLIAFQAAITDRILAMRDVAIIAAYFVVVFALGFYFSRKERTSEDYFLASRKVGWFGSSFASVDGRLIRIRHDQTLRLEEAAGSTYGKKIGRGPESRPSGRKT